MPDAIVVTGSDVTSGVDDVVFARIGSFGVVGPVAADDVTRGLMIMGMPEAGVFWEFPVTRATGMVVPLTMVADDVRGRLKVVPSSLSSRSSES